MPRGRQCKLYNGFTKQVVSFTTGSEKTTRRLAEKIILEWGDRFTLADDLTTAGKRATQYLRYEFFTHGNTQDDVRKRIYNTAKKYKIVIINSEVNIGSPRPYPERCARHRRGQVCEPCTAGMIVRARGENLPLSFTGKRLDEILELSKKG